MTDNIVLTLKPNIFRKAAEYLIGPDAASEFSCLAIERMGLFSSPLTHVLWYARNMLDGDPLPITDDLRECSVDEVDAPNVRQLLLLFAEQFLRDERRRILTKRRVRKHRRHD